MEFKFLNGLDRDIQAALVNQLRDLWTHTSTALEGNTLTLGETKFVIEEGLTVSGKPLKDHQEVIGHARAIDLIYRLLGKPLTDQDLFDLHKAVQTEQTSDIYKPMGGWKVEPNGTYAVNANNKQVFIEYAAPDEVPSLMAEWLNELNSACQKNLSNKDCTEVYAKLHIGFVHIHPFWDGNGRLARLLSNIPLLCAGLPPIVISQSLRQQYINTLANYQLTVGAITGQTGVWPQPDKLAEFSACCLAAYQTTLDLVAGAQVQQEKRSGK